jgi:HIRAN domain-containing protein
VAEPTNAYDENAVQVHYDGTIHIGYITRKMSSRYRDAVDRHERR